MAEGWYWSESVADWVWYYYSDLAEEETEPESDNETEYDEEPAEEKDSRKRSPALIVFDFDDTLLPTTYLGERIDLQSPDMESLTSSQQHQLSALDSEIVDLLTRALHLGSVKVVTDGGHGWVEHAAAYFLPRTARFISRYDVEVLSARSLHQDRYPDSSSARKAAVFADEIAAVGARTLLSVGDSESERYAACSAAGTLGWSAIKILKLAQDPDTREVRRQVAKLDRQIEDTVRSKYHIDADLADV